MFKKLLVCLFIAASTCFCGSAALADDAIRLTVAELSENAGEVVGETVSVDGTVIHVCKHGGKRMFIIGDEPEPSFKITAGDAVGAFDLTLEGSDVVVYGVVQEQKVDAAFLDHWETELDDSHKPEAAHDGEAHGEDEEADDHHDEDTRKQIAALRQKLAESGKDALSFYSLECISFTEEESGV